MPSRRSTSSKSCGACATTPSASIDALALPTVPTVYTVAQVLADPIGLNSRLGTYTNFVNLLDLCALAVPASMRADGTPFGDHAARAGGQRRDARLARPRVPRRHRPAARRDRHGAAALAPLPGRARRRRDRDRGRRRASHRHAAQRRAQVASARASWNGPRRPRTIACSCCRARTPAKPGLLRVGADAGAAVDVEIWTMPAEQFGRFVAVDPRRRCRSAR